VTTRSPGFPFLLKANFLFALLVDGLGYLGCGATCGAVRLEAIAETDQRFPVCYPPLSISAGFAAFFMRVCHENASCSKLFQNVTNSSFVCDVM
jgi:hypothetical protein